MRSFADLLRPQGLHILALPLRRALRRPLRLALRRLPHDRQMTWTRKTIL